MNQCKAGQGQARLNATRKLFREGAWYFVIGVLQIGIDWGIFVVSSFLGMSTAPSNMVGRISGAAFGFWANGRVTFASKETRLGRKQLLRFVLLWSLTTLASTLAMLWMTHAGGLGLAWKTKPLVDLGLSAISFLASRHWVYRQ